MQDYLFRPEFELYHISTDPLELKNLADEKEYAEVLKEMKEKLKEFQRSTRDPWLILWDHDATLQGSGVNL